jgi:hypothetical protein
VVAARRQVCDSIIAILSNLPNTYGQATKNGEGISSTRKGFETLYGLNNGKERKR